MYYSGTSGSFTNIVIYARADRSQSFSSSPNTLKTTRDPSSVTLVREKGQYLHRINSHVCVLHVGRERERKISNNMRLHRRHWPRCLYLCAYDASARRWYRLLLQWYNNNRWPQFVSDMIITLYFIIYTDPSPPSWWLYILWFKLLKTKHCEK